MFTSSLNIFDSKNEYRALIKFFVLGGLSVIDIHMKMVKCLRKSGLNVALQALEMIHVMDVQKLQ